MKTFVSALLAMSFLPIHADDITVDHENIVYCSEEVEADVCLENQKEVKSLEFLVTTCFKVTEAYAWRRTPGYNISLTTLRDNLYKITASSDESLVPTGKGCILKLKLQAPDAEGTYSFSLYNAEVTYSGGSTATLSGYDFQMNVIPSSVVTTSITNMPVQDITLGSFGSIVFIKSDGKVKKLIRKRPESKRTNDRPGVVK